jgi:hypothetical protein
MLMSQIWVREICVAESQIHAHLDLDAEHTLPQQDVSHGVVDEITSRLTGVNHETVCELHGFRTCGAKLAGDDDLTALGAGFHDETQHTVASPEDRLSAPCVCCCDGRGVPSDSQTAEKFVPQALTLGNSRQTSIVDLFGVQLE